MKISYESISYANLLHDKENYRGSYDFPSQDKLEAIGKSLEKNGLKSIPEDLTVQPAEEVLGDKFKGQYITKFGNVRLASVGTCSPAFLADAKLSCKIIAGRTPEQWRTASINSNQHFEISNWRLAREVGLQSKAGQKNKEIATRQSLSPSEVSNLLALNNALEFAEDQELVHLLTAIQENRFAPTEYFARLKAFNEVNDKVKDVKDRVPWNTFIIELDKFCLANPGKLTAKAFSAFKYAAPVITPAPVTPPANGETPAPVTPPANGETPAPVPPTASQAGLPSQQLPVGAQAGNQDPVKNADNSAHGDSLKGQIAHLFLQIEDKLAAIKNGKCRNDTARIVSILQLCDSSVKDGTGIQQLINRFRGKNDI